MKVFKDLYLHGYLNKNSNALSSKKLYGMAKTLGLEDFEVMDSSVYLDRVKVYKEPLNCIIFIAYNNSSIGHFVAAYVNNGTIHYSDSLGESNSKQFINKLKSTNRKVVVHNSTAYQSDNTSNCGYLSLLFLTTHSHASVKQ